MRHFAELSEAAVDYLLFSFGTGRLRCIAWKHKGFDNQMATFDPFCAELDLNLDHHTESAWKPDRKAQP